MILPSFLHSFLQRLDWTFFLHRFFKTILDFALFYPLFNKYFYLFISARCFRSLQSSKKVRSATDLTFQGREKRFFACSGAFLRVSFLRE